MRIDRIKFATALVRADLTCKELATRTGVSRGTVTGVKTGKSCRRETAERLAAGLGVAVEDLAEVKA